jgi:hypothetical protein
VPAGRVRRQAKVASERSAGVATSAE